jgi:hypothetical protein
MTTSIDPPGLVEAIEAGCLAVHPGWVDSIARGDIRVSVSIAVRAAAPILVKAALLEAADDYGTYTEFADWLRERAERIGGAS